MGYVVELEKTKALASMIARILVVMLFSLFFSSIQTPALADAGELALKTVDKPDAEILYVKIPASSSYQVVPVVSPSLDLLPHLIGRLKGIPFAAINAGYFDPHNKETTSYIISNRKVVANPVDNRDFVENPDLYPFIGRMLNRSEFRVLDCNGRRKYAIAKHRDPLGFRCKLLHSVQAGPNLFDTLSMENEAFVAYKDNKRVRDPLGIDKKNARSAVGIDAHGDVILAIAKMKPLKEGLSGVSLSEMSQVMRDLGARQALSLDGGSSSTLWVQGSTYYGKLNKEQKPVQRPIKSALVVIREEHR